MSEKRPKRPEIIFVAPEEERKEESVPLDEEWTQEAVRVCRELALEIEPAIQTILQTRTAQGLDELAKLVFPDLPPLHQVRLFHQAMSLHHNLVHGVFGQSYIPLLPPQDYETFARYFLKQRRVSTGEPS